MFQSLKVSEERASQVVSEITTGSHPQWRFFALLITASMIASFGLVANSTAVIIGAMLVSPLMTPIFGIALGTLQGRPSLWGAAVRAEALGIVLAVGSAWVVGVFDLLGAEATPEMLSRTSPNLIDLLVAIFAGLAGAYALVDERISPALPGVAIATAIVPPLSTCGLCLALGAWSGAGGALLLFFANFVAILVVSLGVFAVTGLAVSTHERTWLGFARRFGPTAVGFLVVTVVLTNSLMRIARHRTIEYGVRETLVSEFRDDPAVDLEDFRQNEHEGRVQVLATVRSPQIVKPKRVAQLETAISERLDRPVDLVVRTSLSKDVSRHGARLLVQRPDLDGAFLRERSDGLDSKEMLAEQVIREQFEDEPSFELTQVDFGSARGRGIVVAYVNSLRPLGRSEIADLEDALRDRLDDPGLHLSMRVDSKLLETRRGPVRIEWTDRREATDDEIDALPEVEAVVRRLVADTLDVIPVHVHFKFHDGRKSVLVEAVGPAPVSRDAVRVCQASLREELGNSYDLHVWYRNDYVVSGDGYTTYDDLTDPDLERRIRILREIFGSPSPATARAENGTNESVDD